MNKRLRTLVILTTITVLIPVSLPRLFSAQVLFSQEYRKRLLGNEAFDSGLYDVAMEYYENYLQNAAGDSPAACDAYFCLIATCLRSNKLDEAQDLYDELKNKFEEFFKNNSTEQDILEYWEAEILLKKGEIEKAAEIFEDILKSTPKENKELTVSALTSLGICKIRQKKWEEAEKVFRELGEAEGNPEAKAIANQQLILINIAKGDIEKAKILLKESSKKGKPLTTKLGLLEVYTLIKERKYPEALQKYNLLKPSAKAPDAIWYILADTHANAYLESKDYDQAISLLEDACIMAPNLHYKEKATLSLINALLAAGKLEKIISTAEMFLDNFPNTVAKDKILLRLIEVLIKEEKYSEVANCASKYLTLSVPTTSDKVKTACETGQVLLRINKYDEAMKYFEYVATNGTDSAEKNRGKFWRAETLLLEGKYDEALKIFKRLKEHDSLWEEKSAYKIAEIHIKQEDYTNAAKTLKSFISKYPESKLQPSPVFLYAEVLTKMEKPEEAIASFVNFATDHPSDKNAFQAYFNAGRLSLDAGNYTQATEYFKKLLSDFEKTEKTPSVLYFLLYASHLVGDNEHSLKYASDLLKQYPNSEFALQALLWQVNYYTETKEYDKALESLKAIEDKFTGQPLIVSKVVYDKASLLYMQGKTADALMTISALEEAYPTAPIFSKSLYLKGDILSSEGKYLDAISSYSKVSQLSKDTQLNNAASGRIGDCYFAMMNYAENPKEKNDILLKAVSYYNKILDEKNLSSLFRVQTLYKLGKCYELLDNEEKAIAMLHEALYGSVLDAKRGEHPNMEWLAKAGIALARLLQSKNTPIAAEAAISVYKTLIKYNIQPTEDFKLHIDEISNKYKLKE